MRRIQLQMPVSLAEGYHSRSQKIRVITERWVADNLFCPRCGNPSISRFENNRPVADFFCPNCQNQYELKCKNGAQLDKVNDGAYATMIARITSFENPDFFFMSYSASDWLVRNFFLVPKHFFTPDIIEKRAPLAATARRAGWVGCNIRLSAIPQAGRIPIIENGHVLEEQEIRKKVETAGSLVVKDLSARGWLFDVLRCVEQLPEETFTLRQMYEFEEELARKYPSNHNIQPKIRQQLQFLRDRGLVEFLSRGVYRKRL